MPHIDSGRARSAMDASSRPPTPRAWLPRFAGAFSVVFTEDAPRKRRGRPAGRPAPAAEPSGAGRFSPARCADAIRSGGRLIAGPGSPTP